MWSNNTRETSFQLIHSFLISTWPVSKRCKFILFYLSRQSKHFFWIHPLNHPSNMYMKPSGTLTGFSVLLKDTSTYDRRSWEFESLGGRLISILSLSHLWMGNINVSFPFSFRVFFQAPVTGLYYNIFLLSSYNCAFLDDYYLYGYLCLQYFLKFLTSV